MKTRTRAKSKAVSPFYLNTKSRFYWEICRDKEVHLHLSRDFNDDNRWEAENTVKLLNVLAGAKAAKEQRP